MPSEAESTASATFAVAARWSATRRRAAALLLIRAHLPHGFYDVEEIALGERLHGEQFRDHLTAIVIGLERPDPLKNAIDLRRRPASPVG